MSAFETLLGVPLFAGVPERWMDHPKWRCGNGHISTTILKSEAKGMNLCLGCYEPVSLTFPEDEEGNTLGAEVLALRRYRAD